MSKRLKYYLMGVALGCLLLMILPRPFNKAKQTHFADQNSVEAEKAKTETQSEGYDREAAQQ